jgi:hypothetical protein
LLITTHDPVVNFVALKWITKSFQDIGEKPRVTKSTIHEPLNTAPFNLYLRSPGFTEIELKPEYFRPKVVIPGVAKVGPFRTIYCNGGSDCEFL